MKVYISADIEGVTGTTHMDEVTKSKPDFREFQEQMTAEVAAACEGALRAGVTDILDLVKMRQGEPHYGKWKATDRLESR
jgi:D-aminopeptidase